MEIKLKKSGNFSPLRYPGGKSVLTTFLSEVIGKYSVKPSVFVEPYCGGGGAALSLLLLEKVEKVLLNDLDPAVYSFWNTVFNHYAWFVSRIKKCDLTMDEWERQHSYYIHNKANPNRNLGFAFFYLNRTNRSGIIEGGPVGGRRQLGRWKLNARFNKETLLKRIEMISAYKSRIDVSCMDGTQVILDNIKDRNVFIYMDPPYYIKGQSLYLNHFSHNEHERLSSILNNNPSGNWLLTYDNTPEIVKLYAKRNRKSYDLNYSARDHKKGTELMIFSDSVHKLLR